MAEKIVNDIFELKKYLKVQSRFSNYSVGNALLVTAKNPNATLLKDRESWKKDRVFVNKDANKIIILEPKNYTNAEGINVSSFYPKEMYDIAETKAKKQIKKYPYKSETILKTILRIAPVRIDIVNSDNAKSVSFNEAKEQIEIKENTEINEMIQGLINEIASIQLDTVQNNEVNNFRNQCVTFMVSQRYGLPLENINIVDVPEEIRQLEPKEIKVEFTPLAECADIIIDKIDRELGTKEIVKNQITRER